MSLNKKIAKNIIKQLNQKNVIGHSITFESQKQADDNLPEINKYLGNYTCEKNWIDQSNGEVNYKFKLLQNVK